MDIEVALCDVGKDLNIKPCTMSQVKTMALQHDWLKPVAAVEFEQIQDQINGGWCISPQYKNTFFQFQLCSSTQVANVSLHSSSLWMKMSKEVTWLEALTLKKLFDWSLDKTPACFSALSNSTCPFTVNSCMRVEWSELVVCTRLFKLGVPAYRASGMHASQCNVQRILAGSCVLPKLSAGLQMLGCGLSLQRLYCTQNCAS